MKKVLNKYREFARYINKEIKVKKDSDWVSYPELKLVGVPQLMEDDGKNAFMSSVLKALPAKQKEIINIIPDFTWFFLHEMGHLQKGSTINDKITRGLANACGRMGLSRLANLIYFNLKEEKQATKWATDYVINNEEVVIKFSNELIKAYKRYYKTMNLTEC
jgi:hypothetical protein